MNTIIDFNLLNTGDKIFLTYNGREEEFVVLGRDVNSQNIFTDYHFVDIMSTRCLVENDATVEALNSTISNFPEEIQGSVVEKEVRVVHHCASEQGWWESKNLGKVWVPSVQELFGEVFSSNSCELDEQYPYFKDADHRKIGDEAWRTASSSAPFCNPAIYGITEDGNCDFYSIDTHLGSPVCLRIKLGHKTLIPYEHLICSCG